MLTSHKKARIPSTTFVLQLNEKPSASRAAVRAVARAAVRSRALSGSVLPVRHLYYNSTKILLPAPSYAPSHAPQSALAPLLLCPPSATFVLQLNENPSDSRAAVRAVARAAVRSRAPPALSSSTTCVLQLNENPSASRARTRRRTALGPDPRAIPLSFPSPVRAVARAAVRAVIRAAVRSRAPPALSSQYYICTTTQRKSLNFPRRRTPYAPSHRSRAPPALIPAPSPFRFHPPYTRRRTRRSPLSRPSGSNPRAIPLSFSCPFRFHPAPPSRYRALAF